MLLQNRKGVAGLGHIERGHSTSARPSQLDLETYLKLRESIAMLYTLNKVPGAPMDNDITNYKTNCSYMGSRSLDLLREKQLAQTLAFLIATTDDPYKVAALCLEEIAHDSLVIKLSANHGDLARTSQDLNVIMDILQGIAAKGKQPCWDKM